MKDQQVTLGYEMITEDFIKCNGRESLLLLAVLFRGYTVRKEFTFTLRHLYKQLGVKSSQTQRKIGVIESLNKLLSTNIDIKHNQNDMIVAKYSVNPSQYVRVSDREVDTILGFKGRANKFNLFNTYLTLKKFVNYKTKRSYPSILFISDVIRVSSNNTVINYISILEDLGIVKVYRDDGYRVVGGRKIRPNNEYEIIKQ